MNVEANVGDVEISLARPIEEYSYDIDCKVGNLEVENKSHAHTHASNTQASSLLTGKLDVGDCDLEFKK